MNLIYIPSDTKVGDKTSIEGEIFILTDKRVIQRCDIAKMITGWSGPIKHFARYVTQYSELTLISENGTKELFIVQNKNNETVSCNVRILNPENYYL